MKRLSALEALLIRAAGALLARGGHSASLVTLIFHRVLPALDPLLPDEPDADTFARQMDLLSDSFNVLPLTEAVQRLRSGSLPPRAVCVTFDDGYANNFDVALPVLAARRIPATVFVAPGFLNGGRMFNDTIIESIRRAPEVLDLGAEGLGSFDLPDTASRIRAIRSIISAIKYRAPADRLALADRVASRVGAELPSDLMMTDDQARQLARSGIEIGAHTVNHPILKSVDPEIARREMAESRRTLQEMTGTAVTTFAYPNGRPAVDYDASHVALAKTAGFQLAMSTAWGAATSASDRYQLPRIAPWDRDARRYTARIIRAYGERRFDVA